MPVCDERAEPAAERAEHVAAQADGGGDEDEETGERLEGAGDRAEDQPGDETGRGGEQMRDEARSDPGWIRANERAEPPHEAEMTQHCVDSEARLHHRLQAMPSTERQPPPGYLCVSGSRGSAAASAGDEGERLDAARQQVDHALVALEQAAHHQRR